MKEIPPIVAVDLETTGLFPSNGERICEVALLKIENGEISREFSTLVNPGTRISPGASMVNGITDGDVKDAPAFCAIAGEISDFFSEGTPVLAHNARFDLSFLNYQLKLCGYPKITNDVVDTLLIARKYFNFESNSLGNLVCSLGIKAEIIHRAQADAFLAYKVLKRFWKNLKGRMKFEDLFFSHEEITTGSPDPDNLMPAWLLGALKNKTDVTIRYLDRSGRMSLRTIRPTEVRVDGNNIYLVALCRLKNGERNFRLDRIIEVMENIE